MSSTISKKTESIDYENEILDFIRENPSGITITDIAKEMGYSRNTVSKYTAILQLKDKIYSKSIGRYNLYFSVKTSFLPKNTIISVFKALLKTLKDSLPNKGLIYKELGKKFFENFEYKFGKSLLKEFAAIKNVKDTKAHLEFFKKLYPSFNFLQDNMEITDMKFESNYKKAIYKFQNSEFLETQDDYIFYFYLIAGIAEAHLSGELNRNVNCEIINVNVGNKKEDSYAEMSIEID